MSLLSVPALVKKGIDVIFIPGKAFFVDIDRNCDVVGVAPQNHDGLYYISDNQKDVPVVDSEDYSETVRAMMAIIGNHVSKPEEDTSSAVDENIDSTYKETDEEDVLYRKGSSSQGVKITEKEEKVRTGPRDKTPQAYKPKSRKSKSNKAKICKTYEATLWNLRLGNAVPKTVVTRELQSGVLPKVTCSQVGCESCSLGKYRRRFAGSLKNEVRIGKLLADIKGEIKVPSVNGHRYFLTVVEEVTRMFYVMLVNTKGEASEELLKVVKCFGRQTDHKVHAVHTDGGSEFFKAKKYL